ncbi:NADH dehydrogenase subunit F [Sulfobacillus acidophilus DSM 10332]|uniref:NADH-quinone oxidoreductase subunit F n=1 Tax=Sulfobacillus acidophilus (strain ATCC 700253 / DSM 10332 / NAL) TaxID=679936 RepID=G8TYI3_SULAD|nr:NADH dehydrogenase subunit F [Sulfobacillus acidophilus DSM 10332]
MSVPRHVLLRNQEIPDIDQFDVYMAHGGYDALKKALAEYEPEALVDLVKRSGLRGRGGAGFPTGVKWGFLPKDGRPRYLVVNSDEAEPGTFKDRELIEHNPHQLIEGMIIASYAIGAREAYVYVRGEFLRGAEQLRRAVREAYAHGFLGERILGSDFSLDIHVYRGAGAYICGEESALLESLEGKRGNPRLKPPFPAVAGLYGLPTIVNNVETICNVPPIVMYGAEWYTSMGTEKSPGIKIMSVSGKVRRPGNYEVPLATPLRTLLEEYAGGMLPGYQIKAVIPGGSSVPLLTADQLDTPLDYESMMAAGTMLGSGGCIVLDDQTCIVKAAARLVKFYREESCGKCTPCREGTYWMTDVLERIEAGLGEADDLTVLLDIADNISGKSFCPLGDAALGFMVSAVKHFREEFEAHIREHRCPMGAKAYDTVNY